MEELWLPVVGYEGLYEVSNLGRVRSLDRVVSNRWGTQSLRRGKITTPVKIGWARRGKHYLGVNLHKMGKQACLPIHRLVLEAFAKPRPEDMECRHLDGNCQNNALVNLTWGTSSENVRDAVRHGTHNNARKTHCPRGHPYDEENTYVGNGKRHCRECTGIRAASQT